MLTSITSQKPVSVGWLGFVLAVLPLSAAQAFTTLYSFDLTHGALPYAGVIEDAKGNLYGTTYEGGSSTNCGEAKCGVVFKLIPGQSGYTISVLYNFTGGSDGLEPYAPLTFDAQGDIYGTTYGGDGSVFELTNGATFKVVHSFKGSDGANPRAGVILDSSGDIYGTTLNGGADSDGTVFEISSSGKESVLHPFAGGNDGANPEAALVTDGKGDYYGTTYDGGNGTYCPYQNSCGTIFEISNGNEKVLYAFCGKQDCVDGYYSRATLILDKKGNLYGTTISGGAYGGGIVFEFSPNGTYTVLYSFGKSDSDGAGPNGGVIADKKGNLYGTTALGGSDGIGSVFKLSKHGVESVLWSFDEIDGGLPLAGLIMDEKHNLFGTASSGGGGEYGTVFTLKE